MTFRVLFDGVVLLLITCFYAIESPAHNPDKLAKKHVPSDQFFLARSYPDQTFSLQAYESAMKEAQIDQQFSKKADGFDADWSLQGPGNIGGRINTLAYHPADTNILYAGCSRGGVFKTTDAGQSWNPIFDDQSFLAIGHISLDPNNPDIVYVGTGDPNISGQPFIGDGAYRSTDAGASWTYIGLKDQRIISRIQASSIDPNVIYAATMGLPMERNNDRGLYKTTDGGQNWQQSLFISNQTGISDMLVHPTQPDTVYASTWDRIRNNTESTVFGPNAGVWKTVDGGQNWARLTNGLPIDTFSRVGLAMSAQNSEVVFALYVGRDYQVAGIYKSLNGGTSWDSIPIAGLDPNALGGFGWYFGQIRVNPGDDSEIYVPGVELHRTTNSGLTWEQASPNWWTYEVHADIHDVQFVTTDRLILATDGGLYLSDDRSQTYRDIENIPNTQFYRVAVNPHTPGTYYGGAQDNGSMGGNAANFNQWERIFGGDGFQMRFDAQDPNIWYCETQNGNLYVSDDGGNGWQGHNDGIDGSDRRNWDMPFALSPSNSNLQVTGTYRIYRNTDGPFTNWIPISGDLTDGIILHPRYHTITTVDISAFDDSLIYAGTVDGNVWVKKGAMQPWTNITTGLPDRYVTSVVPSPQDQPTVFVTHSGYKDNDFIPHIHRSRDYGNSWQDISGDLPQLAINNVTVWPFDDDILFVATDGGVYGTIDGGANWERLGKNMPVISVFDVAIDTAMNQLIAGTFSRSLMTYPVDSILNSLGPPASLAGALSSTRIRTYPNPAVDEISLDYDSRIPGIMTWEILDLNGRSWLKTEKQSGESISLQGLPGGMYLIQTVHENQRFLGKFIKK